MNKTQTRILEAMKIAARDMRHTCAKACVDWYGHPEGTDIADRILCIELPDEEEMETTLELAKMQANL